jgi:3-dehydroquinate dehydratase/shikimate dehydrogenase
VRALYGIVGESVTASLAPRIYNSGFRELGLPALCLPFSVADFGLFWRQLVEAQEPPLGAPVRGLTVVRPHKEEALRIAGAATERARRAGAANSLVFAGDRWRAANTTGVVEPLAEAGVDPAGSTVAVVGCGGAGRAVVSELRRHGANVTLVNRGNPRGRYASRLLGLPWTQLDAFEPDRFAFVVNATPLADESPFEVGALAPGAVVVDLAYRAEAETALVEAARSAGHLVVDGRAVLVAETGSQFQLMTGHPLPRPALEIARNGLAG